MGLKTPGILRLQSLPEGRSPLMLKGLLVLRQRLTRVCMAFWASVSLAELKFLFSCFWLASEWHWWRAKAGAPQPFLFLENGTFWLLLECPLLILFLSWNSPYLGFSKRLWENRRHVKAECDCILNSEEVWAWVPSQQTRRYKNWLDYFPGASAKDIKQSKGRLRRAKIQHQKGTVRWVVHILLVCMTTPPPLKHFLLTLERQAWKTNLKYFKYLQGSRYLLVAVPSL